MFTWVGWRLSTNFYPYLGGMKAVHIFLSLPGWDEDCPQVLPARIPTHRPPPTCRWQIGMDSEWSWYQSWRTSPSWRWHAAPHWRRRIQFNSVSSNRKTEPWLPVQPLNNSDQEQWRWQYPPQSYSLPIYSEGQGRTTFTSIVQLIKNGENPALMRLSHEIFNSLID